MVYNIAYGTGCPGAEFKRVFTSHRYLRSGRRQIDRIAEFVRDYEVDLLGLVEADLGSFRTGGRSQVQYLARKLDMEAASAVKYSLDSMANRMPIIRHQANALLSATPGTVRTHYMSAGFKRMALEVEFPDFNVVLVHLALSRQVRIQQLNDLTELLADRKRLIIGGDFNTFAGEKEVARFKRRLHLYNPNIRKEATYPAWRPLKQLDYLLFSDNIVVTDFQVGNLQASDHLPILADFELIP
jgi:endonuclease/exonuclease/phosphatase family metal-dependent hydrolase